MKPKDENKIRDIHRATLALVKEKGLAGITMGQIAKQAGLATGTVYIYFINKDELINSLFTDCRKASAEVYFKNYDPRAPFKEGFRTVWMNVMHYRMEKFEEAVFIEQCYHSPFINATNRDISNQVLKPLFSLMERGKNEGLIKPMDTLLLLAHIIGSMSEIVRHAHYNGRKLSSKDVEAIFGFCWDGLKN